jgi:hypothetical protein
LAPRFFSNLADRKLEVLASPQFAGRIIGARTEIAARPQASDRHAIAGLRNRIADPELGEKRIAAQIFKPEGLLAAELAAQAALPFYHRKIGGSVGARELGFLRVGRGTGVLAVGCHRRSFRSAKKIAREASIAHLMRFSGAGATPLWATSPR